MSDTIKHTHNIEHCEVHSDAGGHGLKIECPNCGERVIFAEMGWWDTRCQCGSWGLTQIAELEPNE